MCFFRWNLNPLSMALFMLSMASFGIAADDLPSTSVEKTDVASRSGNGVVEHETGSTTEPARKPRQDVVTAALLVIGGIAAVGLFLMALTIFWGGRLRRLARRPLPEQSPIDELWYLKPSKQRPGDASIQTEPTGPTTPPPPQESPESS